MNKGNQLPAFGERAYDEEGLILCHVCGKGYRKLAGHVIRAHGFGTADEYRQEFGLARHGLLSESSKQRHRRHALEQDLAKLGEATRVTSTDAERALHAPRSEEGKRNGLENVIERQRKRQLATHCINGHPYNDANIYWKVQFHSPDRRYRSCRICDREKKRAERQR